MISRSLPRLYDLHAAAVDALRATGATSPLSFASELREVHTLTTDALVELSCALSIAGKAGVFLQVETIVRPAVVALTALLQGLRDEMAARTDVARVG